MKNMSGAAARTGFLRVNRGRRYYITLKKRCVEITDNIK